MARKLAAGNWKMNGTGAALAELEQIATATQGCGVDTVMCLPATLISRAADRVVSSDLAIGGQDSHAALSGAHTGDTSAAMLQEAGARAVILGHSERRTDHHETDAIVCAKTAAAQAQGLRAIVCIGETLEQREAGQTLDVVGTQISASVPDDISAANTVVAYEPVWAIGTGKVPTPDLIAEVHDFIRAGLTERFGDEGNGMRILYGGSVKPSNAAEIFAVSNVDGALVGGASLKADDFNAIITALDAS